MISTAARCESDSGFASLKDLWEMALAEVQVCPDDGGWVAVARIKQIDGLLGQRILRQQWHQALLLDRHGRHEGRQFRYHLGVERAAA